MGTIDFQYHMPSVPSGQSAFATAYTSDYNCASTPPSATTLRCDDPIAYNNATNGTIAAPDVMSTMSLDSVTSYVGTDTGTSPIRAYKYTFTYQDTPFTTSYFDPVSFIQESAAGEHLLTKITPSVYLQSAQQTLPSTVFGYTSPLQDLYRDPSQVEGTSVYGGQTFWQYLNHYENMETGTGATIDYAEAFGNTHGTPYTTDGSGNVTDDRFDPLYCTNNANDSDTSKRCTGVYQHPEDYSWTNQIVTQVQALGTDRSDATLVATTSSTYNLTAIASTADPAGGCNPITGSGVPAWEADCVGDSWAPSSSTSSNHDSDWRDYYHSEFRGFDVIYTVLPDQQEQKADYYFSTEGWGTPQSDGTKYNSGQLYQEDIYQGSSETASTLLSETLNDYAGVSMFSGNPYQSLSACETTLSAIYTPCIVAPLATKTTDYEGNTTGPWPNTTTAYTYDDLNGTNGYVANGYHNLTQEVISSSNAQTITKKWAYNSPDNQTVGGLFYYNVNKVTHSEIDDASGHVWQCQDISYDEGRPSGVPTPAAGLATTVTNYSNCSNQSTTALPTYAAYDEYGNVVVTVDALGATDAGLYTSAGCTLGTTPVDQASAWASVGSYTTCTTYDTETASLPVTLSNAWSQTTDLGYDYTSSLLLNASTDPNGAPSSYGVSYDTSGNETLLASESGETGAYTTRQSESSSCSTSDALPCYQIESNSLLYSSAINRTFYDSQGRAVETRTPGPTAGDDTVVMTVYDDQTHSIWTSEPFEVADGSGWIDPNGATDVNGHTPAGSTTFYDALGRPIAMQDPNYHSPGTGDFLLCHPQRHIYVMYQLWPGNSNGRYQRLFLCSGH